MISTARLILLLIIPLLLLAPCAHAGVSLSYSSKALKLMKQGEYEKAVEELKTSVTRCRGY